MNLLLIRSLTVVSKRCCLALVLVLLPATVSMADGPGWSPVIIPTGQYRSEIKSMPIHERPYRPLHFYGNTVRRNHYRAQAPQSRGVESQRFRVAPPAVFFPAR